MEKIRVVEPGLKLRSKDRDGLYKRRDYWHYELIIDGQKQLHDGDQGLQRSEEEARQGRP